VKVDTKDDGGPAFPALTHPGMSLRDWFAGQVLASPIDDDADADLARRCYAIADAMLAARKKAP
jgi:hypothetical protein